MSYGERNNKWLMPYCPNCQKDYDTIEEVESCFCEVKEND